MYVISAHQRYRRTDGQTDGRTPSDGITAPLLKAWSGKKWQAYTLVNLILKKIGKIAKDLLKTPILGVQGRSRSSMLVSPESSSAVLVMTNSKSVSICNHFCARLVDSSRNRTFSKGHPNLMRSYRGHLEPRVSSLTPTKSTFDAEHFICRLSWSILNGFGAIHS